MTSNNAYRSLLGLFEEFRELIQPKLVERVPDFTAGAMEAQYDELK